MNAETLDWELEARRIAAAFGLKGDCQFKSWYDSARQFQQDGDSLVPLGENICGENVQLYVAYEGVMKFTIWRNGDFDTYIGLTFGGQVRGQTFAGKCVGLVAEGLFHLGLLSPEVEAALEVSVSAHQKMEWMLKRDR